MKEVKSKLDKLDELDELEPVERKKPKRTEKEKAVKPESAEGEESREKKVKFENLKTPATKGNDIYEDQQQKLREKKAQRKQLASDLKQTQSDQIEHMDKTIQRNVQKDIIQNKGLTRKRKKIDRNPRVKKRMKYEAM